MPDEIGTFESRGLARDIAIMDLISGPIELTDGGWDKTESYDQGR